jgi:hypothetical protein
VRDRSAPERPSSSHRGAWLALVGALAVGAVVVLLVAGVIGGGSSPGPANRVAPAPSPTGTPAPATPTRGATVITVLNGTTVTGLARQAADKLQSGGYKIDRVTDAADQAQQASQVSYADGFRRAALDVAHIVGIPAPEVLPIDPSTRAVAGDAANVVVTVGADKAQ